ncbi:hypothetical protein BGX31_003185, partial [Mortierella sp. GBA43]
TDVLGPAPLAIGGVGRPEAAKTLGSFGGARPWPDKCATEPVETVRHYLSTTDRVKGKDT